MESKIICPERICAELDLLETEKMRRHGRAKLPNTRIKTPVRGRWEKLSCDQKRAHVFYQLMQLGSIDEQPKVTCLCGLTVPVQNAYRCFECGAFWCPKCAGKHFGIEKPKYGSVGQLTVKELVGLLKKCSPDLKVFATSPDRKKDFEIISVWTLSDNKSRSNPRHTWVMLKTK